MRHLALITVLMASVATGCSPYAYKSEVGGFAAGVGQLRQAYEAGVNNAATDRATAQALEWNEQRPVLVLVGGCRTATAQPCAVLAKGVVPDVARTPEQEASAAYPILDVLQRYVDALAAVTEAGDRQAFDKARAELTAAVGEAAKAGGNAATGAEASAAANLLLTVGGLTLDARRYRALGAGVLAAKDAIPVISTALGRQMVRLRDVRMRELTEAALHLNAPLGPRTSPAEYASRLDRLQAHVATLELLRRSDPAKAAADLAKAHAALVDALNDDTRQILPVSDAVEEFLKAAKGVHEAFSAKAATT